MLARFAFAASGIALLTGLAGCSGAGSPAQPAQEPPLASGEVRPALAEGSPLTGILGLVKLNVAEHGQVVSAEPVRQPAAVIGDSWTIDASQFFLTSPCNDCLTITGFGLVGDELLLDVEVRHPFPSILVREDLDVFDPRVLLITEGRDEWGYTDFSMMSYPRPSASGPVMTPLAANTDMLRNRDGYTTHFDEDIDPIAGRVLGGNLNPFIDYAIDLIPNDPFSGENPEHRLYQTRMPETQQFQIYLPPTLENFEAYLLLECNYGVSANKFTRLNPQYYVPEFNRKEAIDVNVEANGPFAGLTYGSTIDIEASAADWQQSVIVDPLYPQPANRDQLKQTSDMVRLTACAPGWSTSAITVNAPTAIGATSPIRFLYTASLARNTPLPPAPGAMIPILVQVEDTLHTLPNFLSDPGFDLGQTYDVSAYNIVRIPVNFTGAPFLAPASPALLNADTGLDVRTAPYLGSTAGTARFGMYYEEGVVTGPYSVPPSELQLLFADSTGGFSSYSPARGATNVDFLNGANPLDDYPASPEAHPDPENTMVVRSLEMAPSGDFFAAFGDNNFTVDPLRFNTGITDRVSNSAITGTWNRSTQSFFTQSFYLADGCGSAPGPSPGIKVRQIVQSNVLEGNNFGRWNNLLGFVSAGQNTEACGDIALIEYFGEPYASAGDRALRVNGTAIAIDALGPVDDANGDLFGRLVAGRMRANVWPHFLLVDGVLAPQVFAFNALESFDPVLRESTPTVSVNITGPLLGASPIDMVYIPLSNNPPFGIGGVTQTEDWLVVLYRRTALGNTYFLEVYDAPALTLGAKVLVATDDGAGTWGNAIPILSAMRFDPVNRYLILSGDSNGVTPGGDISVTVLAPQ